MSFEEPGHSHLKGILQSLLITWDLNSHLFNYGGEGDNTALAETNSKPAVDFKGSELGLGPGCGLWLIREGEEKGKQGYGRCLHFYFPQMAGGW